MYTLFDFVELCLTYVLGTLIGVLGNLLNKHVLGSVSIQMSSVFMWLLTVKKQHKIYVYINGIMCK